MLARGGLGVELIERTSGPRDVVCGGFLGWDALGALDRLGITAWSLGAKPIGRVRLIAAEGSVEARLPHRAAGLSRRMLDEALMAAAVQAGALVRRGVAVRAADGPRRVRLDTGELIEAEALLLATGKHELRGVARPREAAAADPVIGFRTALAPSLALQQALEGVIELHLFDGGYAGLLLQEDGSANLCVSAARDRISKAGGIKELIAQLSEELPVLGQRMDDGEAGEWQAVAGIPYGWRARSTAPGLFRLGDQGAVIASLAGDGVAIALASGMEAAAALLRHGPGGAEAYQANFAARARRPLGVASKLRHAAENRKARRSLLRLLRWAPSLLSVGARLTRIGK